MTLSPVLILQTSTLSTDGDFADDGADCYDGFAFFVYHACWGDAVFLHAVERVAADCAAFALWEHEDFAFDALPLQFVSFFDDDACVWVYAAVEGNRLRRDECFCLRLCLCRLFCLLAVPFSSHRCINAFFHAAHLGFHKVLP